MESPINRRLGPRETTPIAQQTGKPAPFLRQIRHQARELVLLQMRDDLGEGDTEFLVAPRRHEHRVAGGSHQFGGAAFVHHFGLGG